MDSINVCTESEHSITAERLTVYGWHEVLERLAVETDGGLVVATLVPLHCFTDQVRLQTSSAVVVISKLIVMKLRE